MALVLSGRGSATAQTPTPLYFPEAGHSIQGAFLAFWRSVPEPLTIFGYPITDEFSDPVNGGTTQYFQRARFDLVMTASGPEVQLANLGSYLYDNNGAPANIPETGPTCRLFPRTNHTVCYAFLQFYDANNGARLFGNPISGLEIREERITQYFEKVRMEWLASRPSGQRVVLTQLGRPAFDKYVYDQSILTNSSLPGNGDAILPYQADVTALSVHAFTSQVLIPAGGQQVLSIIVQDQNVQSVGGAEATVNIVYPDGQAYPIRLTERSSADGIIKVSFPVAQYPPNSLVQITVTVEAQSLKATTLTSFRIWY